MGDEVLLCLAGGRHALRRVAVTWRKGAYAFGQQGWHQMTPRKIGGKAKQNTAPKNAGEMPAAMSLFGRGTQQPNRHEREKCRSLWDDEGWPIKCRLDAQTTANS